jgi:hypothetical protein
MTEFDLIAKLNKTIGKNLQESTYEIIDISTSQISHSRPSLKEVVRVANALGDKVSMECDGACPRKERLR